MKARLAHLVDEYCFTKDQVDLSSFFIIIESLPHPLCFDSSFFFFVSVVLKQILSNDTLNGTNISVVVVKEASA